MRNLPLPVKIIINIILFIIYWFVLNFMAGFLIGVISLTELYNIDKIDDSFYSYISLFMLIVTFITVYYKKSFYVISDNTSNKDIIDIVKEEKNL